ncbi:UbiH/UbiF/VisC/COQ6 family ubiquinone biosynthesis hydroxylase [Methylobacillus arboreus]|uniref:UbiH/UbiF/VisC/COQ6 family ubiquinone biosynthesis hydroxylase n=1 Tax=Methylobacillus arboreus TaxID=755170 RepID=UPI001E2B9FB0|nr:UbiH/UbiF/VisC/COQ6 family ubiquinone biosynthesis hydroxylase [Methylobacillus arboreus]MCB5190717.1 UbiH/UbiF/VisC/COQ6 family ubiquinone biosynthesis hydroxylase [Methylobacillus arboreus]
MTNKTSAVDIFIVGGGMVGSALAARLAPSGMRIALLENRAPTPYDPASAPDLRVSALSPASIHFLEQAQAWFAIAAMRSAPFRRMQVWENRRDQGTLFDAAEVDAQWLGHIVENRLVQLACLEVLQHHENVTVLCPDEVSQISYQPGGSRISLKSGQAFEAKLLIGADGANSQVRKAAGIALDSRQYPMHALVATVNIEGGERDITWQRFTPDGPQSLLPLPGNHASLVWYHRPSEVRRLLTLEDDALLDAFRVHFPAALPEITGLVQKGSFAITRSHATSYARQGVALIGDAAHTIHPLAGQGVNLGFQDATVLSELLLNAWQDKKPVEALTLLKEYERKRKLANHAMQRVMDAFSYGFSNDIAPLRIARNLGLRLANHDGPLKREVIRYALGLKTLSLSIALNLFPK